VHEFLLGSIHAYDYGVFVSACAVHALLSCASDVERPFFGIESMNRYVNFGSISTCRMFKLGRPNLSLKPCTDKYPCNQHAGGEAAVRIRQT
jgi:hypothetical protein